MVGFRQFLSHFEQIANLKGELANYVSLIVDKQDILSDRRIHTLLALHIINN